MNREEFRKLTEKRLVILDGATGTELTRQGMRPGVCTEAWALEHAQILTDLHRGYREAGSDIVYACTFGANRVKLAEFNMADRVSELNEALARLCCEAVGDGLVFGNIAPTGRMVEPFGDLAFEDAVDCYKEQVTALIRGGVDGFVIETMMDIQEARAALIAVRETCDLPAMVSMTYDESGRTLTGTDPTAALVTLQALGADAVGCNCSTGPADMITFLHAMKPHAIVPLFAKPNAGMPQVRDGVTVFDMGPEEFAGFVPEFVARGVNLLGGCCGSNPEFIRRIAEVARSRKPMLPLVRSVSAISSARHAAFFGADRPVGIVGERINPTGKKKLQASLREGSMELVRQYGLEQERAGAAVLDVNFGLSGIDEKQTMVKAVSQLSQIVDLPLAIDSTSPEVVEAALRIYPGRALVNSISLEQERIEKTLPLAAKYGAMFILLPLTDQGIPATCEERVTVVKAVFEHARKFGYTVADVVVDGLVMAVSSEPGAAEETLKLIEWASREWGANSIIGTSNVSFGMPQRRWLNTAFLAMAIGRGLTMAIANPREELTMPVKFAADALAGRDRKLQQYIECMSGAGQARDSGSGPEVKRTPAEQVFDCVLLGEKEKIVAAIDAAMAAGVGASQLVDEYLIPAITRVGDLFDRKEYFLPQLLLGADAMRAAFDHLEPHLRKTGAATGIGKGLPVVLATVKGDVHDIGKNLVGLMLRNYGFKVVDLGKDISARDIVDAAEEHHARIVGLSALMTTTMVEMREVISLARERGLDTRFMVGGAVVDSKYAEAIGADGYSADAIGAVRLAEELADGDESRKQKSKGKN